MYDTYFLSPVFTYVNDAFINCETKPILANGNRHRGR